MELENDEDPFASEYFYDYFFDGEALRGRERVIAWSFIRMGFKIGAVLSAGLVGGTALLLVLLEVL